MSKGKECDLLWPKIWPTFPRRCTWPLGLTRPLGLILGSIDFPLIRSATEPLYKLAEMTDDVHESNLDDIPLNGIHFVALGHFGFYS